MAVPIPVTYAANTIVFGLLTWSNTDGGPIRVQVVTNTNTVESFVAGDFQTSDRAMTNQTTEVLVDLSQFTPTSLPTINTSDELVLTLKKSDNSTIAETLYRCRYAGITTQEQARDNVSSSAARFIYDAGGSEKDIFTV